jgi:hypothetical protein
MERLELSRLAAPEPKSGASTNSATPANATANTSWPGCGVHSALQTIVFDTRLACSFCIPMAERFGNIFFLKNYKEFSQALHTVQLMKTLY